MRPKIFDKKAEVDFSWSWFAKIMLALALIGVLLYVLYSKIAGNFLP